eukprot:scaffold3.g6522.t1
MAAGHTVIMACRSAERCATAKAELDARGLPGTCECAHLDLCNLASIRTFAAEAFHDRAAGQIAASCSGDGSGSSSGKSGNAAAASQRVSPQRQPARSRRQLRVLVNNAAVMGPADCMLPNHFGPYLLTRLLLPHMAPRGRVVTVASQAHYRGSLVVEPDPGGGLRLSPPPPSWYREYARTKLANVLMTAELSRRLQSLGSSVAAYSVSPGRVATNIFAGVPGFLRRPLEWAALTAFQTPAQGARTVLQAALAPELEGRHVLYSHALRPQAASAAARNPALAERLWQLSSREVGLSPEEEGRLWPPH